MSEQNGPLRMAATECEQLMDEFQDLLVADDSLDGLVRSVIQHHGTAAAYVFAGSQPSLMRALFSDRERPFYGQARPLDLPALPLDEAARDIEHLLHEAGLAGDRAEDEAQDPAIGAIDLALEETQDAHQAVWDSLGRVERIVLVTVADGQAPTGTRVATEHRIARSTLQDALERLMAEERHLERDANGKFVLLDPLLAEWLRRR